MTEVAELFPGEYVHIGGDECPKDRWKECEKCQSRIKEEGLNNEHELQSYLIRRVEKILQAKGKKLIGWDEILEGGVSSTASIMYWRAWLKDVPKKVVSTGNNIIMTPGSHCYLDHYQSEDQENEPLAIGGYLPLSKVYSFDPIEGLTAEESKFVLGGQGNTWTEYMETPGHLEYMIFPRACALGEVLWTPVDLKDYDSFLKRMNKHEQRLKYMDINFRKIEDITINNSN